MENFLKQFNDPKHFGLYKVLADNVEQGVANLKTMLQNKQNPDNQQKIKDIQLDFEDYLPQQKNATAINPERVDWKRLETLGLSKEKLEQNGELDKMLNWQKTNYCCPLNFKSSRFPYPQLPSIGVADSFFEK